MLVYVINKDNKPLLKDSKIDHLFLSIVKISFQFSHNLHSPTLKG